MKINLSWPWNISFLLYIFVVSSSAVRFFNPSSDIHLYYQILTGFNASFLTFFLLNALAISVDLIAVIPFYIYIRPASKIADKNCFSQRFWQWTFFTRLVLLINGHSFAYKQIIAILKNDLWIAGIMLAVTVLIYFPSYVTHFNVAYKSKP